MKSQILVLAILIGLLSSCQSTPSVVIDDSTVASDKKGKNNPTSINWNSLNSTPIAGKWIVTLYQEDFSIKTTNYAGFVFEFAANNTLTASKSTSSTLGKWGYGTDDSKKKIIMNFSTVKPLSELSEDWVILEQTSTKLRLQHVSGGNGGTDIVTFELK